MEHRGECKVTNRALQDCIVKDDEIFRRMMCDLIKKMPFDDLRLLVDMEKVDEKSIDALMKKRQLTEWEAATLDELRMSQITLYTIKFSTPDIIDSTNGWGCPSCGASSDNPRTELWRTKAEFNEEPDPHYGWEEVHKCFNCETIYKLNNGT